MSSIRQGGRPARIARWAALACLLVAGPACAAAQGAPSHRAIAVPTLSTDPGLAPGFAWPVSDYAIRCGSTPVRVSVKTPGEWSAQVGSGGFRSTNFFVRPTLTAGQALTVTFHRSGNHPYRHFYVRCLPADFPEYHFTRSAEGGPAFFIMALANDYAAIFDRNGVPVWWYKAAGEPDNAELLSDGTLAWAPVPQLAAQAANYQIHSLDGRRVRAVKAIGGRTDIHDLELLSNGNYLLAARVVRPHLDTSQFGGSPDARVLGFEIQEVTPRGELVWSWSSLDHIGLDQTPSSWWSMALEDPEPYDVQHWNSLDLRGKFLLLSFRHLNAVYEINRLTGNVVWKLGGTRTPESLNVIDNPHRRHPLGGAHDARFGPNDTITIHDNNTDVGTQPRVVRYRIHPRAGTARLISSIADPEVAKSICCGSARRLASGSWLVGWGGVGLVGAYDESGDRLFKLVTPGAFSYRALPIPEGALSASRLRQAMDTMAP